MTEKERIYLEAFEYARDLGPARLDQKIKELKTKRHKLLDRLL